MDGNTRPDGLTYDYGPVSNSSPTFNSNSSPPITGSSNATSSSEPGPADQNTASNGLDGRPKEPTVPAACLGCRSKHLKCDGGNPCSRCVSTELECVYIASRRGYKGPRRGTAHNPNKRQAVSPPDSSRSLSNGADCPMLLGAGSMSTSISGSSFSPGIALPGANPVPHYQTAAGVSNAQLYRSYCIANGIDVSPSAQSQSGSVMGAGIPAKNLPERCIDSFYHFFHAAHPFVLPQKWLMPMAADGSLEVLLAAMRWAGALYIRAQPSIRDRLLDEAYQLIYDPQTTQDGFYVQALMVLIVGLDGSCEQEKARDLLGRAEGTAIHIGLNTRPFASLNGKGMLILEESWRRTWWDMFIISGMIAGVHRVTNFFLFDVPTDVGLPCEEHQYVAGDIPLPMYLEDLEDQEFSGDDREFSSFAYRILCGRNLGKFMRTPPIFGPEDENLARIEILLTNWRLHLPLAKRDALQRNGKLDEMMFQAHMMLNATSIMLHQPHSQLDSSPAQNINSCAPHQAVVSGDLFNAHTKHTIAAAGEISRMITHRVPLLSHTHFFTCVVTLSSIVHLSKWALSFIPHDDDDLRQQIRLNIGALNTLSEVWGAADRARGQVKGVAQEIYRGKKQQQLLNPHYWTGYTQEEMLESIVADDTILSEVENLQPANEQHLSIV